MFLDLKNPLVVFSSKGTLKQCDNALTATLNASLSIGASSEDGSVLVSVKNISPLVCKEKYHKVFVVCPTIGVTYSGLQPDFRAQLSVAQKICQEYFDVYNRFPTVDVFIAEFSLAVQEFTQSKGLRPFGSFLIFAGKSGNGPACYQIDPSGSYRQMLVAAGGLKYEEAAKFVSRRHGTLDDNVASCLRALKEYAGKDIGFLDVSIGVYENTKQRFRVYTADEIKEVFDADQ